MDLISEFLRIVLRSYQRLFMRNKNISRILGPAFDSIIKNAVTSLGLRHFAGERYQLPLSIEYRFSECIEDAIEAFINKLSGNRQIPDDQASFIKEYFASENVTSEFSKLLEPGIEYFDIYYLTEAYASARKESSIAFSDEEIFEAWKEFLKGFSFSSRSKSGFREFLTASYEEGSFLALSDIRSAIENVETNVATLHSQRATLENSVSLYEDELLSYKEWANKYIQDNSERKLQ